MAKPFGLAVEAAWPSGCGVFWKPFLGTADI
jgi:hypothetical protein